MTYQADPWERFLILWMAFAETMDEREPTFSEAPIEKGPRDRLEKAGLIGSKGKRPTYIFLEDAAWDFVIENLGGPLPKTEKAALLLHRVLTKLKRSLVEGQSLTEFIGDIGPRKPRPPAAKKKPKGNARAKTVRPKEVRTEQELRAVCLSLGGGQTGKRIRLADLRANVAASRELVDQLLQSMQQAGSLVLFKLDNPAEITPDDERAALHIAGHPRHLVYLEAR